MKHATRTPTPVSQSVVLWNQLTGQHIPAGGQLNNPKTSNNWSRSTQKDLRGCHYALPRRVKNFLGIYLNIFRPPFCKYHVSECALKPTSQLDFYEKLCDFSNEESLLQSNLTLFRIINNHVVQLVFFSTGYPSIIMQIPQRWECTGGGETVAEEEEAIDDPEFLRRQCLEGDKRMHQRHLHMFTNNFQRPIGQARNLGA